MRLYSLAAYEAHGMRIWVDADACPKVIKEILFRAAKRAQVQVTLVANQSLRAPASQHIKSLQVPAGFDVADNEIVKNVAAGDLVVTADIPLAATPAAPAAGGPYPLTARLVGRFTGWNGSTTFTLDNGEVWQQVDDSSLSTGGIMNPKITISRGLINAYYLSVEGVKDTVLVRRIKP